MFPHFLELPAELKRPIVKKLTAIPYIRFRQTCRFSDLFCEEHRRHLGIYIYRKTPEIFLLNSLKTTFPFNDRITEDEEDIDEPFVVVDYGRFKGDSNLKLPMTLDNISTIRAAISGFNFPEISILNYSSPDDDRRNSIFNQAFSHFMEVIQDVKIDTVNLKNLPLNLYNQLIEKWNIDMVRLRKSHFNNELIKSDLIKKIRYFSCTFTDDFDPNSVNFNKLLKTKAILTLDFESIDISWSDLEKSFKNYEEKLPEVFFYRIYVEETPDFYEIDLLEKQGIIVPLAAFHMELKLKCISNCGPEMAGNKTEKFDYFFQEIKPAERWRLTKISRKKWSSSTDIGLIFEIHNCENCLNLGFLSIVEEILIGFYVFDYSDLWLKIKEAEEIEGKKKVILDFIEFAADLFREE